MARAAPAATAFPASERLTPYVSRLAIEWMRDYPAVRHRQIDGTLVFVDISGFTSLTERLSKKGKVGAEEMNDILDATFTDLLSVAFDHGADVIKWGGDATLLLFTGDAHASRACRAALEMQRTIRAVGRLRTSAGQVTLRMSLGIHSDAFEFFFVGTLHRELVVAGPAATATVTAESIANAGEVVVTAATAAALDASQLGPARGPGFLLRSAPAVEIDLPPPMAAVGDVDLGRCIPVAIASHLGAGGGEAEHRPLTVAFVHFGNTEEFLDQHGTEALADALERCLDTVEGIALEHKISLFDTDIAGNGGKIMLVSGAPTSSGNDEERMLRAMRAVLDAGGSLPLRIGLEQGRIFVANFGPSYRRTYSIKADAVNLAARLMAKARPGELLATERVLARSRTSFETHPLPPFQAKGKAEPVKAHAVGAPLRAVDREEETVLVGRSRELAALLDALACARLADGRLIEIVAEPGMGKSTLLSAFKREAADVRKVTIQCDEYEASNPYHPLHGLLRDLLGLEPANGVTELQAAISRRAPQLLPWVPLIATAAGLEAPDTPETAALDEQFRRQQLERTVVELLGMILMDTTLLVFEDVHWLDEATSDLVLEIARQLETRPWLVVLTRRDSGRSFTGDGGETIRLEALGAEEAAQLLSEATAEHPLPPHQLAELARRAEGNPLFLTELLAAARSPEGLAELPDSVETLLMTQIDRLAPDDRTVLRCAAVVGTSFTPALLESAAGVLLDADVALRLGDFVVDEGAGRLRFRHALVRDAAYEGLPYRRRRDLHAGVGTAIETSADDPETEAELLSLHFFNAGQMEKSWRYSRVAGNRAKDIFANVEAAVFFERALESARRLPVADREVGEVSEALGDVKVRLGEFQAASAAFRTTRRQPSADAVGRARLMLKEATIAWRLGRYTQALRWLGRGLRELEGLEDKAAGAERARICATTGLVRGRQTRRRQAIAWLERAIDDAKKSGADDALALAYYLLDHQYEALGLLESVANSQRALAIYEALGDVERQAIVLNSLGVYAHAQGRWDESVELYERARAAWEHSGNHWAASFAITNRAEVLSDQGRYEEAEALFRAALRVARASHSAGRVADVSVHLARLLGRRQEFDEALRLLADARAQYVGAGDRSELLATDARRAECLALAGRSEEALTLADETLRAAATTEGSSPLLPLLGRTRGWALMQLGRSAEATEALEVSLAAGRRLGMDHEVALTLSTLSTLTPERTSEAELERDSIFARLGVVAAAEIPLSAAATA